VVQRANDLWQIPVAAEVSCKRVPLNRTNVRDASDDLLKFVLELGLTNIPQVLEERNVNEARDSDLESHLVRPEHQHGETTRRCPSVMEALTERPEVESFRRGTALPSAGDAGPQRLFCSSRRAPGDRSLAKECDTIAGPRPLYQQRFPPAHSSSRLVAPTPMVAE